MKFEGFSHPRKPQHSVGLHFPPLDDYFYKKNAILIIHVRNDFTFTIFILRQMIRGPELLTCAKFLLTEAYMNNFSSH